MKRLIAGLLFVTIAAMADASGPFGENVFLTKYKGMTLNQLRQEMSAKVPTKRGFLGEAIAAHGTNAWPMLKDALADSDWRTRSCALSALQQLFPESRSREDKAKQAELLKSMPGLIDLLTEKLRDPHFWVRSDAARLLGRMGEAARPAALELAKLCGDEQPWVRTSAVEALGKIPDPPQEARNQGVTRVLNSKRTSFADSRFAMQVIRGKDDEVKDLKELQDALFRFVENPGEGMWSDNLSQAIKVLINSEADPKRLHKLFGKVLTSPLYEQRGDPRSVVCNEILKLDNPKPFAASLKKAVEREKNLLARGMTTNKDRLDILEQALEKAQ